MRRNRATRAWLAVFIWCVLFVVLLFARSYTFRSAIVYDEGVFLYGGMAWARGELPYRDFWDHKAPGITLFHSIPIRLFGTSLLAVRLHEVFWLAVSATVLFYLFRAHLSLGIAVLSLLFYCLFVSTKLIIRSGGLTEESALTFHALSYLFALRRRGSLRLNIFLAGLFLGVAAQFRQPYGMSVVFIVLCLLWRAEGSEVPFKRRIRLLPLLAVGAVLPELVSSGYFLLKGIWPEYVESSYLFNFLYMGGGPDVRGLREGFLKHREILEATGPYLVSPAFVAALLWWLPRRLKRVGAMMIVAFLCDFAAITLGGRYYEHYYVQAAISSSFLLGLAFQAMYGRMRSVVLPVRNRFGRPETVPPPARPEAGAELPMPRRRRVASWALYWCAAAVAGACVLMTAAGVKTYVKSYKMEKSQRGGKYAQQEAIANVIKMLTQPDDRVLVLGGSAMSEAPFTSLYFLSDRLAGSRYYHLAPFFRKAFAHSVRERHRARFLSDLRSKKPVLIVLAPGERQIAFAGMDVVRRSVAGEAALAYLEENYAPLESRPECPLSRIRRTLDWPKYGRICSFLIRKDALEEVRERLRQGEV